LCLQLFELLASLNQLIFALWVHSLSVSKLCLVSVSSVGFFSDLINWWAIIINNEWVLNFNRGFIYESLSAEFFQCFEFIKPKMMMINFQMNINKIETFSFSTIDKWQNISSCVNNVMTMQTLWERQTLILNSWLIIIDFSQFSFYFNKQFSEFFMVKFCWFLRIRLTPLRCRDVGWWVVKILIRFLRFCLMQLLNSTQYKAKFFDISNNNTIWYSNVTCLLKWK
jgi:hypothetical protein